ncbi:MAG: M23 family metallopeptidase [Candidatus Omnitrophota bacterium]|nr:M23 family metallopeptidase [Candidatus Omnitrophota bacterium]
MPRIYLIILLSSALCGCATAPTAPPDSGPRAPGNIYTLKSGEYKYPASGYLFAWPIKGDIASSFGSKIGRIVNKGIDIKANDGMNVHAAKAGRVVYCNRRLKGFGETVILDHGNGYQTVYAYNSSIIAKIGDEVRQNDIIAKAGRTGRARGPMLHFEIRKDGEPQNPYYHLPH